MPVHYLNTWLVVPPIYIIPAGAQRGKKSLEVSQRSRSSSFPGMWHVFFFSFFVFMSFGALPSSSSYENRSRASRAISVLILERTHSESAESAQVQKWQRRKVVLLSLILSFAPTEVLPHSSHLPLKIKNFWLLLVPRAFTVDTRQQAQASSFAFARGPRRNNACFTVCSYVDTILAGLDQPPDSAHDHRAKSRTRPSLPRQNVWPGIFYHPVLPRPEPGRRRASERPSDA